MQQLKLSVERTEAAYPEINQTKMTLVQGTTYGILDCAKHVYKSYNSLYDQSTSLNGILYNNSPTLTEGYRWMKEAIEEDSPVSIKSDKEKLKYQKERVKEYIDALTEISNYCEEKIKYWPEGSNYQFTLTRNGLIKLLNAAILSIDAQNR